MISYIKGKVIQRGLDFAIINTGNIGFLVHLSEKNMAKLKNEVELYTYLSSKREIFELYGFVDYSEFQLFSMLLTVSGIGPKAALKITSLGNMEDFQTAIEKNDHEFFKQIKGVGKKTIQKMILELSGKFEEFKDFSKELNKQDKDVLEALKKLGYTRQESIEAILLIPNDIETTKERVKIALKNLYTK